MIRKLSLFFVLTLGFVYSGFSQVPVAGITATPASGCPPLAISFNGTATGTGPFTWAWTFPGGSPTTSNAQNPLVIYNVSGSYTATLTVTNSNGTSQPKTQIITVNPVPIADFTWDKKTGCYPTNVHFTDASNPGAGSINSWLWDFGDGSQSNIQNPTHKYTYADSFDVTLYVTSSLGCTGMAQYKKVKGAVIITGGVSANFDVSLLSTCTLPVNATFTSTSVTYGGMSYQWLFGDGATGSGSTASHPYTTPASYNVSLIANSDQGCTDTITKPINITASGNNTQMSAPDTVCVNTLVTFKNTSSPPPLTSTWDFGDAGATGSGIITTYTYTTPGVYTVTLSNTYPGCNGSVQKTIHVVSPPTTDFSGTNLTGCKLPLSVNFTNLSSGATSWLWDFGDGTMYNGQTPPAHLYINPGSYNVTLQTSSGSGCATPITKVNYVKVDTPKVVFDNMPAFGCAPFNFAPTATAVALDGIASYSWNIAGTVFNVQNPPAQNYAQGIYPVTLTVNTNGGCSVTIKDTIKVGTIKPIPNFTLAPNPDCLKDPVTFTSTGTGADQWTWRFGDGSTGTGAIATHPYSTPNTYTVTLIAFNQGCPDSISKSVVVNGPKSDFIFTTSCGASNIFTFTDKSIGAITYDWDFGDGGPHSTAPNPTHSFPSGASASYNVTLKTSTPTCDNFSTQKVTANQSTTIGPSVPTVCAGTSIFLTANAPTPGTISSYTFRLGNGDSVVGNSASIAYTYPKPGTYKITVVTTDNTGCIDSSGTLNYVVHGSIVNFTVPTLLSCGPLTTTFTDLSVTSPGSTYHWDFGDGQSSTQQSPTHTYPTQGVYLPNLTINDAFGCSNSMSATNPIVVSILSPKYITTYLNQEDSNFCPTTVINFQNQSSGGFAPTYTWDFNDGSTGTGFSQTHVYPTPGKYYDTLIMTDFYGCVKKYSTPYFINIDIPVANFTLSATNSSCPPLNEQFTFTGSYAAKFDWDFTDGNTSTSKNPINLYITPGDYFPFVTITSPGGCKAVSAPQHIHIDGPIGQLTYSPDSSCGPMTVNFNIATSNSVKIDWFFGDNTADSLSNLPSVSHLYSIAGQYNPFVVLRDASGCKVNYAGKFPINIDSIGQTLIKADKNSLCDSGVVKFKDSSLLGDYTVIKYYIWDFNDGSPIDSGATVNAPSHFFASPGFYNVSLTIKTFGGCTGTTTIPIAVSPAPKIAISGLLSQCEPALLTFGGVEVIPDPYPPLTWTWDFGNGQTGTGPNPPSVSYPKAGEYIVQATATNAKGCTTKTDTTAPNHLFIYPIPSVLAGADTTICLGDNLQLNATGNATAYNWLPPVVGNLSCLPCANPVATNTTSTTYFIVNGSSIQGCQAKDTINVTVNTPVTITASGIDSVCLGQSTRLNATGGAIYNWTPATGLSDPNIANPLATPTAAQVGTGNSSIITYTVTGYDNKKCFSDTDSVQITAFNYPVVNAGPDATINVGTSYQINATTTGNIVSLDWQPNTNLSCSNCLTPVATPTKTISYGLTAINDGGCPTTDSIRIQVICNGANFFIPNTFSPNGDGVNDYFVINGVGLNVIPSITIYNRWGQMVFQKSNFAANSTSEAWDGNFNGKPAPPDVYIYTIQILCNNATLIPYHGNVTLIR